MAAVGTVYEVVLKGNYLGSVQTRNVYHFQCGSDEGQDAFDIATAFEERLVAGFLGNLASAQTFTSISATNLFIRNDFYELPISAVGFGDVGSQAMPPYVTYGVRLTHSNPDNIRSGSKRYTGVVESLVANGLIEQDIYDLAAPVFADFHALPLVDALTGLIAIARPVVVKRIAEIVGGVTQYRVPVSLAETIVGFVLDAILTRALGTQNTRKYGNGI